MNFHPIANILPMMRAEEFAALKEDIRVNGQQEPIWTFEGQIIDGRNRFVACHELGLEPKYREWTGNGSPVSFVVSVNQHRRHLTQSQKAAAAVGFLPLLEQEAKERQSTSTGGNAPQLMAKLPQAEGTARQQAAKMMKVGARYVSDAKQIQESAPELFAEILKGEKSLSEVKRAMKQAQIRQEAHSTGSGLPPGKFRVIYADPPWSHGDRNKSTDKTSSISAHVDDGAGKHNPSMSTAELRAMDIKSICDDDAVLFIWVASPFLFECASVIKAWGFSYKASFVWDKVKREKGQFNSERHDFLLVCTRGSRLPKTSELYDSIERVERSEAHSEKPDEFRQIVDALYPCGKRLELFARKPVDGWETHGNVQAG